MTSGPTGGGPTRRQLRLKPRLIVNTGEGKGKSTAASGIALRAWHQGWSIAIFQFVKSGKWGSGEIEALRALGRVHELTGQGGRVEAHTMGRGWTWTRAAGSPDDQRAAAVAGWDEVRARLQRQAHDLYLLDEFSYPINRGWIDLGEVIETLVRRPGTQHVVITGRAAPPELIKIADLVTEMTKIKHPYDLGEPGQAGIEW